MRLVFCGLGHQIVLLLHFPELLSATPSSLLETPDIGVVVFSMVPRCETFREASILDVYISIVCCVSIVEIKLITRSFRLLDNRCRNVW